MTREDLAGVADGGTLRRLASGLEIVRRRKHEPIELQGLPRTELIRLTGKRFGSKFLPTWTLERLTEWIAREVEERAWATGEPQEADVDFEAAVGMVAGAEVATIRILSDGRYVHAFPVPRGQ